MLQLSESKKRLDDQQETMDGYDDVKKKMQRDVDALQQRVDALTDENDRMNKSKKKMQTEVHTCGPIWYYIIFFLSSVFAHYHAASISMSAYTSELTLPSGISSLLALRPLVGRIHVPKLTIWLQNPQLWYSLGLISHS